MVFMREDTVGAQRPNLRDEQKRRTRLALLEAARGLFTENGYADVTVDDITRAVGCSRATFYLHFTNKTDILARISAETMQQRAASVYGDLDAVLRDGSRAAFTAWIERALEWFDANRDILPAWDEALSADPEFRSVGRASITALTDAMPDYLSRWPDDRREEARFRIELLVTQLERYFTRSTVQRTIEFAPDRAADVLTDIWYPALQPPGTR
ncbi:MULTISPECIES: TetR/AcrR family transcriptional regulator [Gordonia]|uniref:TetR/AcrR family transcriptional regulator n=2 Tax=Gordonia TaxID=2053 RepID=A0ABP5V256_9ACTN|nr:MULTISPECIES: TetR/AcrR family transcriptional regulator [Gordonia]AUH68031.1 TetR/AcrR family transcriptional regulator [Gordonia sp. YC-JH1]KJR09207.1 TetR family transcriptional regulator [Gordonia sihwensis]KXT58917.1 TetR family transcriptional regulator [Gordonia sp. QH-12]MBY4569328.1 TetR family transcriptional regulator [Gordonia sihwensis]WFN92240.1 helix-turn-helix domain containing protein [Gordonia sihwensis]